MNINHKYDYAIIGAGIVGLCTAYALIQKNPKAKIVILEKEMTPGFHQTGHNSGVIHAGIYYAPGSLKAILCRQGLDETKEFCSKYNIPFQECGKLIVATNDIELDRIYDLHKRGTDNDLLLHMISSTALHTMEPNINGLEAVLSPETAIVDYKLIAQRLADILCDAGVEIKFAEEIKEIHEDANWVKVSTKNSQYISEKLIVCGGLQSDRLAIISGLDIDFKIIPFRGEYFRLKPADNNIVSHLIYPAPDPQLPFLGVHLTRMIGGYVTVGPNAVLGFAREGYNKFTFNIKDTLDYVGYKGFWSLMLKYKSHAIHELKGSLSKVSYLKECQKYCPKLKLDDLLPYRAGIRAQAVKDDGTPIHDFVFIETERMLHVCNAPSPAATSALPIGRMIADKC